MHRVGIPLRALYSRPFCLGRETTPRLRTACTQSPPPRASPSPRSRSLPSPCRFSKEIHMEFRLQTFSEAISLHALLSARASHRVTLNAAAQSLLAACPELSALSARALRDAEKVTLAYSVVLALGGALVGPTPGMGAQRAAHSQPREHPRSTPRPRAPCEEATTRTHPCSFPTDPKVSVCVLEPGTTHRPALSIRP